MAARLVGRKLHGVPEPQPRRTPTMTSSHRWNNRSSWLSTTLLAGLLVFAALAVVGTQGAGAHGTAHAGHSAGGDSDAKRLLLQARNATHRYRTPEAAQQAGYVLTPDCVEQPGVGGMGIHAVNEQLMADGELQHREPEILVYAKNRHGRLRLVALEYFALDPDGDPATDDRPSLFGQPFDGPFADAGAPPVYLLHAWVHKRNPAGVFAPFNPRVSC
jgi:hypothetical protein